MKKKNRIITPNRRYYRPSKKAMYRFRDMWPFRLAGLQIAWLLEIVMDVGMGDLKIGVTDVG